MRWGAAAGRRGDLAQNLTTWTQMAYLKPGDIFRDLDDLDLDEEMRARMKASIEAMRWPPMPPSPALIAAGYPEAERVEGVAGHPDWDVTVTPYEEPGIKDMLRPKQGLHFSGTSPARYARLTHKGGEPCLLERHGPHAEGTQQCGFEEGYALALAYVRTGMLEVGAEDEPIEAQAQRLRNAWRGARDAAVRCRTDYDNVYAQGTWMAEAVSAGAGVHAFMDRMDWLEAAYLELTGEAFPEERPKAVQYRPGRAPG